MKISLNTPILNQPYGGGMAFAIQLKEYLEDHGVRVIDHLRDEDIDIVFHLNVTYTFCYTFYEAYLYKINHPKTIIIQRVNDSGYQRNDRMLTHFTTLCSYYSDYIIYISNWLKNEMLQKLLEHRPYKVIYNGGDIVNFTPMFKTPWDRRSKMKIVTHHWSNNYEKGHAIYQYLDTLLNNIEFCDKYEFTYIGNYPKHLEYKNTQLLPPLSKEELSSELKTHHVYLSASRNEAAGMHVIEGALSGLPLLYLSSGGIPEYAQGYGISFTTENFVDKLNKMYLEYDKYYPLMKSYDKIGTIMSKKYFSLLEELMQNRAEIFIKNTRNKYIMTSKIYLWLRSKIYKYNLRLGPIINKNYHSICTL